MGTYKGNAGNLMQHWTLCELLATAGRHTSGLSFIDAHAMAPLASGNVGKDALFGRVEDGLPNHPGSAYEQAWHHLAPNGGYPNSAAFVKKVWEGDLSLLLCETDPSTIANLKPWLGRARRLARCKSAELFQGDWRKRFDAGLPSASEVGLADGSLTLVSFDPDMYYRQSPQTLNPRNLYPCDLKRVLAALERVKGGVVIQLSTYSRGRRNEAPQGAAISSVDSILVGGGFTRAAKVPYDGNMMSLVYARNVPWSAELAELPGRFEKWVESQSRGDRSPCECGCGNFPKGPKSRYLPGHDAKHLATLVKELRAKELEP